MAEETVERRDESKLKDTRPSILGSKTAYWILRLIVNSMDTFV